MSRNHLPRFRRAAAATLSVALMLTNPAPDVHAQEANGQSAEQADPSQAAPAPPAQLAVSPGRFEIEITDRPSVHAVRLMNFGDEEVSVRASVVPWDLDEQNRVRELEITEQTLDQAMVFNPREFTIPARSEQTVRFSIRPRVRPAPGEHRAMIYFEEQPREVTDGQLQVLFKVGVAVYAYAGDISRVGELDDVQVRSNDTIFNAAFDIGSRGNAHVRMMGQYAIWPADRFPGLDSVRPFQDIGRPDFQPPEPVLRVGSLPTTPVLAGTTRQLILAAAHSLVPGDYVFTAVGTLGGDEIRRAVPFQVPRTGAPVAAGQQD